jgi:nucleoside phosphorylase
MESKAELVILAALPQELQAVWPHLRRTRRHRAGDVRYHRGEYSGCATEDRVAIVGRTGVGPILAGQRVPTLLNIAAARGVLMLGFAGALDPSLRAGDVVVASEVVGLRLGDGAHAEEPLWSTWRTDPRALEIAGGISLPAERGKSVSGRIVTVSKVCTTAVEKSELGRRTGTLAVDMESAVVAEECDRRGLPLVCVRAILDEAELELPLDLDGLMTPSGRPRPLRLVGTVARHPGALGALAGLRQRTGRAVGSLREFLSRLLDQWPR